MPGVGEYVGGEPSLVTHGGTPVTIKGVVDAGFTGTAEIDAVLADDLPYEVDGGLISAAFEQTLGFRSLRDEGATLFSALFAPGTLISVLAVTLAGKGTLSAGTLTATTAKARVTNFARANENRRGRVNVTLKPLSSDGSTSPIAWATA